MVKDWRKSEMNMLDKLYFKKKIKRQPPEAYHLDLLHDNAFYTLTLTNREAEVPWPALSTEETLKVSFTQAPVAAAIIFTDVCSCCQGITSAP